MALVVDIAFQKRVTSATRFKKLCKRFKANWKCASFQITTVSTTTSISISTQSVLDETTTSTSDSIQSIVDEPSIVDESVELTQIITDAPTDSASYISCSYLIVIPTKDWLYNNGLRVVNYILNHAQNIG